MRLEFKVVWSNKWWLFPMDRIKKDGYFIGYTNRFKNYTYRLKPIIRKTVKIKK